MKPSTSEGPVAPQGPLGASERGGRFFVCHTHKEPEDDELGGAFVFAAKPLDGVVDAVEIPSLGRRQELTGADRISTMLAAALLSLVGTNPIHQGVSHECSQGREELLARGRIARGRSSFQLKPGLVHEICRRDRMAPSDAPQFGVRNRLQLRVSTDEKILEIPGGMKFGSRDTAHGEKIWPRNRIPKRKR